MTASEIFKIGDPVKLSEEGKKYFADALKQGNFQQEGVVVGFPKFGNQMVKILQEGKKFHVTFNVKHWEKQ